MRKTPTRRGRALAALTALGITAVSLFTPVAAAIAGPETYPYSSADSAQLEHSPPTGVALNYLNYSYPADPNLADAPTVTQNNEAPVITVDLRAAWDTSATAPVPAGAQVLAYFVLAANDVEFGSAGNHNFTVVVEGVNAGFATYARGTASNGGRTLTIPFTNFQLATSERFGFSLIGDQQGDMSAIVRVYDDENREVAQAELAPKPVLPGTLQWDLVLSQSPYGGGSIQDQLVGAHLNLTIDRTSPIPVGDIIFYFGFADINPESSLVPAVSRFRSRDPLGGRYLAQAAGGPFVVGGGPRIFAYVAEVGQGWRVSIPANRFNPFGDLPRSGNGETIDPDQRVFATMNLEFYSGPISKTFGSSIFFASEVWGVSWGDLPESDRGAPTEVGGEMTVNNRNTHTFSPAGGHSTHWVPNEGTNAPTWQRNIWGDHETHFPPTPSLQTVSAVYSDVWSASDWLPYGSEVLSRVGTVGNGYVAACLSIDPTRTPFEGRVEVFERSSLTDRSHIQLWATRASVGNLQGVDCHTLDGWFQVPAFGLAAGNHDASSRYMLPDPASITAIKALGFNDVIVHAMHHTRMASPQESGWVTGRGWWPRSADVFDHYQVTRDDPHEHAATPGHLFASTNGSRDIIHGNYGFPRVVKSVSNQNPDFGETVTFTIRAVNVSNFGNMAMTVFDQMDARLAFVPGSAALNGSAIGDPTISGVQSARFVPGAQVRELVFNLGYLPVNQIQTITFDAVARWDVGTVINSAWMEPTEQARQHGFTGINSANGTLSQVNLHRQLTGNIELAKQVARSFMAPDAGALAGTVSAANTWQLSVLNGTSLPTASTVIDIFPFYGDGRGTTPNVMHMVSGFATDHPVVVYYTVSSPSSLNPDPAAPANAQPGTGSSVWRSWEEFAAGQTRTWDRTSNPTAFLISTATPINSGARVNYQIGFTAQTEVGQTGTFVNYAWQRDDANQLRLVRAAVTVSEFPEIAVYKTLYGQVQPVENHAVRVPHGESHTVVFELVNTGTEPLSNLTFHDQTLAGREVTDIIFEGLGFNEAGYLTYTATSTLVVLAPGARLTATGTLPALNIAELHHNVVHVGGTGVNTGRLVQDDDPLIVEAVEVPVGIALDKFIADAGLATGIILAQEITFRITNTGGEPLTNLVFTDVTLELPSLTSVAFPSVPDAVITPLPTSAGTGTDWRVDFGPEFVLLPGEVLSGIGMLPPLPNGETKHHNVATIVGFGVYTRTEVTAVDDLLIHQPDLPAIPVAARPMHPATGVTAGFILVGGAALATGAGLLTRYLMAAKAQAKFNP